MVFGAEFFVSKHFEALLSITSELCSSFLQTDGWRCCRTYSNETIHAFTDIQGDQCPGVPKPWACKVVGGLGRGCWVESPKDWKVRCGPTVSKYDFGREKEGHLSDVDVVAQSPSFRKP